MMKYGTEHLVTLLDSGASGSLITRSAAEQIVIKSNGTLQISPMTQPEVLIGVGGMRTAANEEIIVPISKHEFRTTARLTVMPNGSFGPTQVLLGWEFMSTQKEKLTLEPKERLLTIGNLKLNLSRNGEEAYEAFVNNKEIINRADYKPTRFAATIQVDYDEPKSPLQSQHIATLTTEDTKIVEDATVIARKDVIIPHGMETKFYAQILWGMPQQQTGIFEAMPQQQELTFGNAIVTVNEFGEILVSVLNISGDSICLKEGTVIGAYTTAIADEMETTLRDTATMQHQQQTKKYTDEEWKEIESTIKQLNSNDSLSNSVVMTLSSNTEAEKA